MFPRNFAILVMLLFPVVGACQRTSVDVEPQQRVDDKPDDQSPLTQSEKEMDLDRPHQGQQPDETETDQGVTAHEAGQGGQGQSLPGVNVTIKVSCLEVLERRFGAERIFYPAMQLFPDIYEKAEQAGANGIQYLREQLSQQRCDNLAQRRQ